MLEHHQCDVQSGRGASVTIGLQPQISSLHGFSGPPFTSGYLTGNPCDVAVTTSAQAEVTSLPVQGSAATLCTTWATGDRRAAVRCQTAAGNPIQCCGHGLLCCATQWLATWQAPGTLEACGGAIPCRRENEKTWVGLPTLSSTSVPIPAWLADTLGMAPSLILRCSQPAPDDSYLVVEMQPDTDLSTVTRPDSAIANHTRRALIVTQRVSRAKALCDEDIQLRYFAPQYGVAEDSATGSAMRVLAHYWQPLGTQLTALQRSCNGGYLYSQLDGDCTWVGGHVAHNQERQPL